MIRAPIATAVVAAAAAGAVGHRLYKSGKPDRPLDTIARRIGFRRPPALDVAYAGANASPGLR